MSATTPGKQRLVLQYPAPPLCYPAAPVGHFDAGLRHLAADLVVTMQAHDGAGLAAPQIGETIRLAVISNQALGEDSHLVLVNPKITGRRREKLGVEGCLSVPGLIGQVARPRRVRIEAQKLDGEAITLELDGFAARVACHEIDHLDGVMFWERMPRNRRRKAERWLAVRGLLPEPHKNAAPGPPPIRAK